MECHVLIRLQDVIFSEGEMQIGVSANHCNSLLKDIKNKGNCFHDNGG